MLANTKYLAGQNISLQDSLKNVSDSLKDLQRSLYVTKRTSQERTYAFVTLDYSEPEYPGGNEGVVVSDVTERYSPTDEENYRWMDAFTHSFLQEHRYHNYSITNRKVYTFDNYVDASKKREHVYKYGIDAEKRWDKVN